MQPNWQQQPSYGYAGGGFQPQQTGFQGGQSGMPNQSYLSSQPTGFPMQQTMQTGFNPRPTPNAQNGSAGGPGGGYSFLNQPPPSSFNRGPMTSSFTGASGLSAQMTGYPAGGASGLLSQQTGFQGGMMSQPTGMGLISQPTGMGRLQAQPTGMPHDPRLQTMMQSFMPSNTSQPFLPSGVPQFNPTPQSQPLSQTFQSLLQNPTVETPKVPWTISRQEKKDYDQIFRAWDQKGDGFISGDMAREVFGQSGLGQDDLMKIWNLSDADNRGKLNLPEFHVAMGLIYRALNGNRIPDTLPEEMVPPSMRDIDTTVTFMRDLLKHEASTRSNTSSPAYGAPVGAQSKDAKVYKHDDSRPSGYKSSSRHLDRKSVRYAGEDSNADIGDIRRQLTNTSAMLDRHNDDYARKSEEDEALEQELDDLKYRVKRIQEDIEYVSKGKRTSEKDEERRKLERELLFLMHEKLPELERRQEDREEEKRREERQGTRARDRRNETHGRYGDYEREEDRGYMRGTYDRRDDRRDRDSRDRDYGRDRYDSRDRSRDREDRYREPPAAREAPPTPSAPPKTDISAPPPPPPAPTPATAAPSTKNMTAEERSAFIRAEAQRRIQERLKALGVEPSTPDAPAVDNSVQERLDREKREAEEKSKAAEKEQEAREEARKKRLEGPTEEQKPPSAPAKSAMKKPPAPPPAPASRNKPAPPAPVSRNASAAAPPPVAEDPEEIELRQREEARQKAIADRKARLKALEDEEEEERKKEEALLAARKNRATANVSSPARESTPAPPAQAPPAPPAPTPPAGSSYNPFKRNVGGNAASSVSTPPTAAAPANGGFNPFFKPPVASESSSAPSDSALPPPPPPPPAPAPPSFSAPPRQASGPPPEEDWDVIQEKQIDSDDDSSDDEYASSRNKRGDLARALFGNILPQTTGSNPSSRPGSTAPTSAGAPPPPPGPPKPPPAALAKLGGGDAAPESRGALFAAIQGGAKLRKAQTVDKSGPAVAGKILGGDPSPPPARYQPPPSPSPEPISSAAPGSSSGTSLNFDDAFIPPNPNRQSVDWYAGLAADTSHPSASADSHLESFTEEKEDEETLAVDGGPQSSDDLSDFDLTKEIRVRTLFPYDGQRDVDLTFIENVIITAHPAKDASSPWWYGTLVKEGRKGWFPHSYVEEIHVSHAKALYTYAGGGEEELPFAEGDTIAIIDKSDENWWKTEKAGVVFIVPASYLETIG